MLTKGKFLVSFEVPGHTKDYTLYLSDPQAQYNKLLRTQQKLRDKIPNHHPHTQ